MDTLETNRFINMQSAMASVVNHKDLKELQEVSDVLYLPELFTIFR